jgi:AmpD protein
MNYDPDSGLIDIARYVASSNCDLRPEGVDVESLIIHAISLPPGEFGGQGIEQLFCNALDADEHPYYSEICGLKVSAHLLVRRDGEIVQFVPLNQRAWHAGVSECLGRDNVNDFSIGIELEGSDDAAFEDIQYQRLAQLTTVILDAFPGLSAEHIYGHSDIAPGRKTDPGPHFDWQRFRALFNQTA